MSPSSPRRLHIAPGWEKKLVPDATGLTVDPAGGRIVGGKANLWAGFNKTPTPGAWPLLRTHIEDVICSGDEASIAYMFNWLAWTLQNPAKPSEVVLVLRGAGSTGKTRIAQVLLDIFGTHGMSLYQRWHFTGRYNFHLFNGCFVSLDEINWPGKVGMRTVKRFATEPSRFYRAKGFEIGEAPNRLSMMMTANEDWVAPESDGERWLAVVNVSDKHQGDLPYFTALIAEIENGGAEAFFFDMLAVDLSGWHPRNDVPQTKCVARQGRR